MTEHDPADELTPDPTAPHHPDRSPDWDPRGREVNRDALGTYDAMRSRCPVAHGPDGAWTLFSHAAVTAAALDHETFSNAVSRHLQVPNGLDGPEHTAFRAVIERYFTAARVRALVPTVQSIATHLAGRLDAPGQVDAVALGARFAVRGACAWLGWPVELEDELLTWVADNRAATRSRDQARTAETARRFDAVVRRQTETRRRAGDAAPDDVTTELTRERVDGRPLTDEEIVSILRNWTGGDLGSMALCTGVVLAHLADHPPLQARLRAGVSDRELDAVLDEILRLDDPFVSNRRVATASVELDGRQIAEGDLVVLHWTAANRDPRLFAPGRFDPAGHAPYNLVWGLGKHVCPGRPLATMELRVLVRAVLAATSSIEPDPERPREREVPPAGGYASVPLLLR